MFCIAFLVRIYIGEPIVRLLQPRLIGERLHGIARGIAVTALPVAVTSPVTSAIVALMFSSPDDFADVYVSSLTFTMPTTMLVNYLVIGPFVKLTFSRIAPAFGLRVLRLLGQHAASLARLLNL